MQNVIDVNQLEVVPREHSDNTHIVRREDLKVGLISVRPHDELSVHSHGSEEQFYYTLDGEGIVRMGDQDYPMRSGTAVTIPPGTPHGVRNTGDVPLRYIDVFIAWKK